MSTLIRSLPPFLISEHPPEPEDLPLQVHLLTLELAAQREAMARLAQALMDKGMRDEALAIAPYSVPFEAEAADA